MNSPLDAPVNTRLPAVDNVPDQLGCSVHGICHLDFPVKGSIAARSVVTAYNLLRQGGVDLGKRDFLMGPET